MWGGRAQWGNQSCRQSPGRSCCTRCGPGVTEAGAGRRRAGDARAGGQLGQAPGSRARVTRTGTSEEGVGARPEVGPLTAVLRRSGGGGRALGVVRQVQEAGLPGGQQEASPALREGCFQLTCLPSQTVGPTGGGNTGIVRCVTRPSARLPRVIAQRGDSEEAPWAVGSKLCPSARCGALTEQHQPGLSTGALLTARGCAARVRAAPWCARCLLSVLCGVWQPAEGAPGCPDKDADPIVSAPSS